MTARCILALGTLAALAACAPSEPAGPDAAAATPSGAEAACLDAVGDQTGAEGVSLMNSGPDGPDTVVSVSVPGGAAPWSCRAAPDGSVSDVTYTGSDG